ncbi:MAG: beta-galactosidase GalA, partial [Sedimentisphaerales bacterium]
YFAKTGFGDGPASLNFDDRTWRLLDLPHDWAVEVPFDSRGSHSHGYKAIGRNFPETSVGWYRKSFSIPESDLGRCISIEFDGVFRDSIVWVNGFYLGREPSGYNGFRYDITDYLNYGGNNIVAVRVDATMEEGWFYEGAGIYRHVWLTKTPPIHVAQYGTFVTSEIGNNSTTITADTTVVNEGKKEADFEILQIINDPAGKQVTKAKLQKLTLKPGQTKEYRSTMKVKNPNLWSLESPSLYKLNTSLHSKDVIIDNYETTFGIRSVRFDPNEGFFLNGKHVKLKGTNNHQDHAGVGAAIPDALQYFRIARLKEMGSNAYRCSHNPPTPELLDACDRLGMLVLDENRLMGTTPQITSKLERLILRDRNHPCVIAWSLGNEEWTIEGNIKGARIASTMQDYAMRLDPTRRITTAISGGWGNGISTVIDVMGYNYIHSKNTDEQHAKFPEQPGMGTEETTTRFTRGVYFDDKAVGHMAPVLGDQGGENVSGGNMETGWKHYAQRPYLAGPFYWTGFDYRGEPNPLRFPAISSQFGILDTCGFPKDSFYYLKSWWSDQPVLHIYPHWNWPGKEGQEINVVCFSTCDEVELFLNDQSLGKKTMEKNSHLEWKVAYQPGTLLAKGFKEGQEVLIERVETTGEPAAIRLIPNRDSIKADGKDVSVITVQVEDDKGRIIPVAGNEITFNLQGSGKILGVGNGDPASHEPDQFLDTTRIEKIKELKMSFTTAKKDFPQAAYDFADSNWPAFKQAEEVNKPMKDTLIIIRGSFQLPAVTDNTAVTLFTKSICDNQTIYVNGHLVASDIKHNAPNQDYKLDHSILKSGKNIYTAIGTPLVKMQQWENLNIDPGVVKVFIPAETWKRKVFNGLAQIIVQSAQQPGEITLTATSPALQPATVKIKTLPANL